MVSGFSFLFAAVYIAFSACLAALTVLAFLQKNLRKDEQTGEGDKDAKKRKITDGQGIASSERKCVGVVAEKRASINIEVGKLADKQAKPRYKILAE